MTSISHTIQQINKINKSGGSKLETCYQCGEKHDYLHLIDLGHVGYGSMLDGCQVSIPICDECLYNFVMGLKLKDRVLNSGSNYGYDELQKAYQRVKL